MRTRFAQCVTCVVLAYVHDAFAHLDCLSTQSVLGIDAALRIGVDTDKMCVAWCATALSSHCWLLSECVFGMQQTLGGVRVCACCTDVGPAPVIIKHELRYHPVVGTWALVGHCKTSSYMWQPLCFERIMDV